MKTPWFVLFLVAGCASGCSGGGSRVYYPIADDGGSLPGGDLGSAHDLAQATPDLASMPPDLAVARDLTVPPDLSMPCRAGHYAGPLSGTVSFGGTFNVTGTVDVTLDPPQNGVLAISNGRMVATFAFNGMASADVVGSLDCGTLRLTGTLQNGKASALGQSYPFAGSVAADYDTQASALVNGTWMTTGITGSGTWSAQ